MRCEFWTQIRLPDNEVVVAVVDDSRDAAIGVVLGELGSFVLAFLEVKIDRFVRQAKLREHESDLPGGRTWSDPTYA